MNMRRVSIVALSGFLLACPSDDDGGGQTGTESGTETSTTSASGTAGTSSTSGATTMATSTSASGTTMDVTTDDSATTDDSGTSGGEVGPSPQCVAMVEAATAFLDGLDMTQREQASFDWDDPVRQAFEFLPPNSSARAGLSLRDVDETQRDLFDAFLAAALSDPGFMQATGVMALESVLAMQESGMPVTDNRDPDNYFIHIFGAPSVDSDEPWGWRFEGHHMSVHTSVIACAQFSATPTFWGVSGGTDPMDTEIMLSQQLFDALDDGQQAMADVGTGSEAVDTKSGRIDPLAAVGLPAGMMDAGQQMLLRQLIGEYVGNMIDPVAEQRLTAIEEAGFDNISFAWGGGQGDFRILGPTFIIEWVWAGQGHVHSVWRDYEGDYGDDLIDRHMSAYHHHGHPH